MTTWQETLKDSVAKPPSDLSLEGLQELRSSSLRLYPLKEFHSPNVYSGPMHTRGRIVAAVDRHKAEAPRLREAAFGGWWGPIDWEFGSFVIGPHHIPLLTTSLWDSTCTTGAQHRTLEERPILSGYRWQF